MLTSLVFVAAPEDVDVEIESEEDEEIIVSGQGDRLRGVILTEEKLVELNQREAPLAEGVDTRARPKTREDCEAPPRPCPWCEDRVVMRASRKGIHCPVCKGAVTLVPLSADVDSYLRWEWQRTEKPADSEGYEHARPCPFVGCRHHLFLDAKRPSSLKLTYADVEPEQMDEGEARVHPSCSLDAADEGRLSLEGAGEALNLTRERVRQIQESIVARIKRSHVRLRILDSP